MDNEKNLQRIQTAALFISTTQEMLNEMSMDEISIRKIAERAGYHNSTIYLHFKDLDELLMLASMIHFNDYSQALEELSNNLHSPLDTFISIWDLFTGSIYQQPEIFYNFFFGKRSNDLRKIMTTYYTVFPKERKKFSTEIESMYYGNNIHERSLRILRLLLQEDTAVTEDNLDMINDIIVSCCKSKLEMKCRQKELDSEKLKQDFKEILFYVCGINI